jgi:hypothetical protein
MKKILALSSNNTMGTSQIVEGGCYRSNGQADSLSE